MPTSDPLCLLRYYAAVDSGDIDAALRLMAPDVRFAIMLAGTVRRGHDRQGIADYLGGRGDVQRAHVPLRTAADGELEFVYGAVVEDSITTTGHFLASVRVDRDGLIGAYQVAFDPELALLPTRKDRDVTVSTPALVRWFAAMDSDSPDDVLGMITDDFHMSVQFSRGAGQSSEFVGDRQGLIGYLEQREKSTFIHHVLAGSRIGQVELVLGKTTRDGDFEASFNATAQLDDATGLLRRLLICRTPAVEFAEE